MLPIPIGLAVRLGDNGCGESVRFWLATVCGQTRLGDDADTASSLLGHTPTIFF